MRNAERSAGVVVGIQKLHLREQVADGMSLDQGGFARSIGAGDNPEFGSNHSATGSGLTQSGPFGAVKMLDETSGEFRGAKIRAGLRRLPGTGADEGGFQSVDQFLLLRGRKVSDCFENFGNRAHAGENTAVGRGVQAELNWN